jgi:hypothetical protein
MSSLNRVAAVLTLSLPALAAQAQDSKDHDPLFADDEIIHVRMEGPFEMMQKERPDDVEAPGTFSFSGADGEEIILDVNIRTRGNYRRNRKVCELPPLRLNFQKRQTKDTLFDKQDKLKLVTHCQTGSNRYEQTVLSEYLAYRVFNILTDRSFRVRLLRITYAYTDKEREIEGYGILIEHKDRLEKRLDGKSVSTEVVSYADIQPDDLNLAFVFQYFLGNTDFSPIQTAPDEDCCHNQALLVKEDALDYTIPYDFDLTGFVNAPHAVVNPRFKLRSVRTRLYRGRCFNLAQLPVSLELFREKREAIESLFASRPELRPATLRHLERYTAAFYETINDPNRVQREFVKKCT